MKLCADNVVEYSNVKLFSNFSKSIFMSPTRRQLKRFGTCDNTLSISCTKCSTLPFGCLYKAHIINSLFFVFISIHVFS